MLAEQVSIPNLYLHFVPESLQLIPQPRLKAQSLFNAVSEFIQLRMIGMVKSRREHNEMPFGLGTLYNVVPLSLYTVRENTTTQGEFFLLCGKAFWKFDCITVSPFLEHQLAELFGCNLFGESKSFHFVFLRHQFKGN